MVLDFVYRISTTKSRTMGTMGEIKKELAVVALSTSESSQGNYALILEDTETRKRMPIIVGQFEAQAIAVTMERMQPTRPMTHDLLKNVLAALGARLKEVTIHSLIDGVFYSALSLEKEDKSIIEMDSRTSDAITLAVRFEVPIYTFENIIEEACILSDSQLMRYKKGSLAEYTLEELEELLEKIITKEDYKSAARIRDLIEKRKKNKG